MRFARLLHSITHIHHEYDFGPPDEQLTALAALCYDRCVDWFGPPVDPHRGYEIVRGPQGMTSKPGPMSSKYTIVIHRNFGHQEQLCGQIAHEMFHRVVVWRPGLIRILWVNEMMAFLTSQHVLREQGFHDYATVEANRWRSDLEAMDVQASEKAKLQRSFFGLLGARYPPGFAGGVYVLATRLERLVDWDHMRRIVHCRTWEEWMAPFSRDVRQEVRRLLASP